MGPRSQYLETVLTCKGDYYSPDFHRQLSEFRERLQRLIFIADEQSLILKKVEPWNSVRVTIKIPADAAQRLRELAERRDSILSDLGVLAVQIDGDQAISLNIAGGSDTKTNVVAGTPAASAGHASTSNAVDIGAAQWHMDQTSAASSSGAAFPHMSGIVHQSNFVGTVAEQATLASAPFDSHLQDIFAGGGMETLVSMAHGLIPLSDIGFPMDHANLDVSSSQASANLALAADGNSLCFLSPSKIAGACGQQDVASTSPLLVNLLQTRQGLRAGGMSNGNTAASIHYPTAGGAPPRASLDDSSQLLMPPPIKRRRSQNRRPKQHRTDSALSSPLISGNTSDMTSLQGPASCVLPETQIAPSFKFQDDSKSGAARARHMINPYTGNLELVNEAEEDGQETFVHGRAISAKRTVVTGSVFSSSSSVSVTQSSTAIADMRPIDSAATGPQLPVSLSTSAKSQLFPAAIDICSQRPAVRFVIPAPPVAATTMDDAPSNSHATGSCMRTCPTDLTSLPKPIRATSCLGMNILAPSTKSTPDANAALHTGQFTVNSSVAPHVDWYTAASIVDKHVKSVSECLLAEKCANGLSEKHSLEEIVRQSLAGVTAPLTSSDHLVVPNTTTPAVSTGYPAAGMPFPYIAVRFPPPMKSQSMVSVGVSTGTTVISEATGTAHVTKIPTTAAVGGTGVSTTSSESLTVSSAAAAGCRPSLTIPSSLTTELLTALTMAKQNGRNLPVYDLVENWSKAAANLPESSRQGILDIALTSRILSEHPMASSSSGTAATEPPKKDMPQIAVRLPNPITVASSENCFFPAVSCFPPEQRRKTDLRPPVGIIPMPLTLGSSAGSASMPGLPSAISTPAARPSVLASLSVAGASSGWFGSSSGHYSATLRGPTGPSTTTGSVTTLPCSFVVAVPSTAHDTKLPPASLTMTAAAGATSDDSFRHLMPFISTTSVAAGGLPVNCVTRAPLMPSDKLPAAKTAITNLNLKGTTVLPFGNRFFVPQSTGSVPFLTNELDRLDLELATSSNLLAVHQFIPPPLMSETIGKMKTAFGGKPTSKHASVKDRRTGASRVMSDDVMAPTQQQQRGSGKSHLTVAQLLDLAKNARLNQSAVDDDQKSGELPSDVTLSPRRQQANMISSTQTSLHNYFVTSTQMQSGQSTSLRLPNPLSSAATSFPPFSGYSHLPTFRHPIMSTQISSQPSLESVSVPAISSSITFSSFLSSSELGGKFFSESRRSPVLPTSSTPSAVSSSLPHIVPLSALAMQSPLLITSPRYPLNLTESVKKAMRGVGLYPSPPASPTISVQAFTPSKLSDIRPFSLSARIGVAEVGSGDGININKLPSPDLSLTDSISSAGDKPVVPPLNESPSFSEQSVPPVTILNTDLKTVPDPVMTIPHIEPSVSVLPNSSNSVISAMDTNLSGDVVINAVDVAMASTFGTSPPLDDVVSSVSSDVLPITAEDIHELMTASDIADQLPLTVSIADSLPPAEPAPDLSSESAVEIGSESEPMSQNSLVDSQTAPPFADNASLVNACTTIPETTTTTPMPVESVPTPVTLGNNVSSTGTGEGLSVDDSVHLPEDGLGSEMTPADVIECHLDPNVSVDSAATDVFPPNEDDYILDGIASTLTDFSDLHDIDLEAAEKSPEQEMKSDNVSEACTINVQPASPVNDSSDLKSTSAVSEVANHLPDAPLKESLPAVVMLRPRRKKAQEVVITNVNSQATNGQYMSLRHATTPATTAAGAATRMTTRSSQRSIAPSRSSTVATTTTDHQPLNEMSPSLTKSCLRRTPSKVVSDCRPTSVVDSNDVVASSAPTSDGVETEAAVSQHRRSLRASRTVPAAENSALVDDGKISLRSRRQISKAAAVADVPVVMTTRRRILTRGANSSKHVDTNALLAGDTAAAAGVKENENCIEADLNGLGNDV